MNERQQRECPLRPEWIRWWRESLRVIQDQGSLVLADGAIYRIDHARKRVVLVHGTPSRGIVDRRCIEAVGTATRFSRTRRRRRSWRSRAGTRARRSSARSVRIDC